MKKNKGFSLIEIVVVLAIMGVIAAFLTPMLFNYMSDSKLRRAQSDVQNIAAAINRFNTDTGVYPVYTDKPLQKAKASVKVLVTNGNDAEATGFTTWNETWSTNSYLQSHLEKGLIKDGVSYSEAVQNPNKWAGPYMTDFKADSWGNRYYVSTEGFTPGSSKAAFVLSAGPNGAIDTVLSQESGTSSAFAVGGDDIAYRIK
ncbi:MAG TPA: prepilin-type N-terminal cleavage/methylation domain-containing protein [Candidatus Wunengus sp. YC63]|uniref:prepilin-type N-terminal cleavage/methylation domain-containing protein n=1 Tax=unclassified Candidatus Wunengus TaxID=3367695 RepID=UPI004026B41E